MSSGLFLGLDKVVAEGPYGVVLIDPPWPYPYDPNKKSSAGKHYSLVSLQHLQSLPIASLLASPGVMFCWTTASFLSEALTLAKGWGLHYRGVPFVWVKTSKVTGSPIRAKGIRPSIVKPTTELVLAFSPRKAGRPLPLSDESIRQVVLAPTREHSRKPDEVHSNIERMYPSTSKLEMFARTTRAGWSSWGNEVGKFDRAEIE